MKALRNVGLALVFLFALTALPAMASASTDTAPVSFSMDVPCAAGGAGEEVYFSGNIHTVSNITLDGSGGFHSENHVNASEISGVGVTTGDKYQATSATNETRYLSGQVGAEYEYTYVSSFQIIGEGTAVNFLVHYRYHLTVNANGEWTADFSNYRAECK